MLPNKLNTKSYKRFITKTLLNKLLICDRLFRIDFKAILNLTVLNKKTEVSFYRYLCVMNYVLNAMTCFFLC